VDTLTLNAPLRTTEPTVLLDPRLKPGVYRAVLVVEGTSGESLPAELLIRVVDLATPTRISGLTILRPN